MQRLSDYVRSCDPPKIKTVDVYTVFQWKRVDYGTVSILSSNFGVLLLQ